MEAEGSHTCVWWVSSSEGLKMCPVPFSFSLFRAEGACLPSQWSSIPRAWPPLDRRTCGQPHQESPECVERGHSPPPWWPVLWRLGGQRLSSPSSHPPAPMSFHSSAPGVCPGLVHKLKEQGFPAAFLPCGRGADAPERRPRIDARGSPGRPLWQLLCGQMSLALPHVECGANFEETDTAYNSIKKNMGWALYRGRRWREINLRSMWGV